MVFFSKIGRNRTELVLNLLDGALFRKALVANLFRNSPNAIVIIVFSDGATTLVGWLKFLLFLLLVSPPFWLDICVH